MSESTEQAAVILAADDDDDILDLVCLTLEQVGHTMLRASDGDEALGLARRHKPDLCVLDVVMPNRTGIQVVEALRGEAETARDPDPAADGDRQREGPDFRDREGQRALYEEAVQSSGASGPRGGAASLSLTVSLRIEQVRAI